MVGRSWSLKSGQELHRRFPYLIGSYVRWFARSTHFWVNLRWSIYVVSPPSCTGEERTLKLVGVEPRGKRTTRPFALGWGRQFVAGSASRAARLGHGARMIDLQAP